MNRHPTRRYSARPKTLQGLKRFPPKDSAEKCRLTKIRCVSSHDVKAVAQRRGGDESVAGGKVRPAFCAAAVISTPNMTRFQIDGKKAVLIVVLQRLQPALQGTFSFASLSRPMPLGDFSPTTTERTLIKKIPVIGGFHRAPDCGVTLGAAFSSERTQVVP